MQYGGLLKAPFPNFWKYDVQIYRTCCILTAITSLVLADDRVFWGGAKKNFISGFVQNANPMGDPQANLPLAPEYLTSMPKHRPAAKAHNLTEHCSPWN